METVRVMWFPVKLMSRKWANMLSRDVQMHFERKIMQEFAPPLSMYLTGENAGCRDFAAHSACDVHAGFTPAVALLQVIR